MKTRISPFALDLIFLMIHMFKSELVSSEVRKLNETFASSYAREEIQDHTLETISQNRKDGCDIPLDYKEQFCVVENSTIRDCLVQRANLINSRMCEKLRPKSPSRFTCQYAEICIFTVPFELEETCIEQTHNCTVTDFNNVTCISTEHLTFTTRCYVSFVHCPIGSNCRRELEGAAIKELFQSNGTCSEAHERVLRRNESWYWINQDHFNDDSGGFGDLQLINSPMDHCREPAMVLSRGPYWHLILIVTTVFIVLVFIAKGIVKLRRFVLSTYPDNSKDDPLFIQLVRIW